MKLPALSLRSAALASVLLASLCHSAPAATDDIGKPSSLAPSRVVLTYLQPARRWLDSLPVGNGRIGAMIFGGVATERIALNESTFWSGAPGTDHDNPAAREQLAGIRSKLFAGDYREAVGLISRHMLGRQGNYGTHLPVGDLFLDMPHGEAAVSGYERHLNLASAVAETSYSVDGVRFTRAVFASHPDQALVILLTADKPGSISFKLRVQPNSKSAELTTTAADTLAMTESARENKHSDGKTGVLLSGLLRVGIDKGHCRSGSDLIEVSGADSATILVCLATDFPGLGEPRKIDASDAMGRCRDQLTAAARHSPAELRRRHTADHARLFGRVGMDLGHSAADTLPTDVRMKRVREGAEDPGLAALFFQYGRYLLVAGSREDSPLPTNLQGIWNDNLACNMGWTCDFHLDINTQQNYWPAEVANLSECHAPLFRLLESMRKPGRRTARTVYGADGWVCHVFTNPWGYTAPGWGLGWGLHPTGGIWLGSHLWQHYDFTRDRKFLGDTAYPVLKEAAEFFLSYMVIDPRNGWLVTGPSTSPENSFTGPDGQGSFSESMGPTCDIVLVRDLFESCVEASRILAKDAPFRARLEEALGKLPPLRVGRHGQLMEWLQDFEEAAPNHRHTTHLIALYPSAQITPDRTPALAEAARTTLQRRLSQKDWEDVEWSRGNLIHFYARLGDGESAHKHLRGLLAEDTDLDLLTFSRGGIAGAPENIFCVDGNSAGASGIAEMLVQSHGGELRLLPALPRAWPTGSVRGFKARGNITVDMDWRDGRVVGLTLSASDRTPVKVRVNGEERSLVPGRAR